MSDEFQLSHKLTEPNYVTRTDQTIVAWDDVPEHIQQKILNGTMTEEDWDSDWGVKALPEYWEKRDQERSVTDIVSEALCELPVAKYYLGPRHVHVFRKEYEKCMIKGCDARSSHQN